MKRQFGFTLIELLIVVAIIAILAAIAVPNFLEAQVRSKVSRTKADMRTVATALESYRVDHNGYPGFALLPQPFSLPGGPVVSSDVCLGGSQGLTTPIAYLTSIPPDPFGEVLPNDLFTFGGATGIADGYYYSTKAWFDCRGFGWGIYAAGDPVGNPAAWVIQSKGPDKYFADPTGIGAAEVDAAVKWQYDPTNGTISNGNVVRFGP